MPKKDSLRETVRTHVLEQIQNGQLRTGDKLTELSICKQLGISRTPVREALLLLSSEGLLEYTPHRGFTIKGMDQKAKEDTYEILTLLDALSARLALPHMTPADLSELNRCADLIDIAIKYHNYPDYCQLQQQFHDIYRNRCSNQVLIHLLQELQVGCPPQTYYSEDQSQLFSVFSTMNQEHRKIIALFEAGDPQKLFDYLCYHWDTRYEEMI